MLNYMLFQHTTIINSFQLIIRNVKVFDFLLLSGYGNDDRLIKTSYGLFSKQFNDSGAKVIDWILKCIHRLTS